MSKTVKLSSKLPGDPEINGLDALHPRLIVSDDVILCFAWVVSTKVVRDLNTDEEVPTVEIRRIEPIGGVDVIPPEITEYVAQLYEKRTNKNPLPIGALLAPAGSVDELDEPVQAGDVAESLLATRPAPGADVFVYEVES